MGNEIPDVSCHIHSNVDSSENGDKMTMDQIDKDQLYNTAWKHWGGETQLDMLIEEMAELTQALLKARRNGVMFSYGVAEELADVCICIEQVKTRMKRLPYDVLEHGLKKNLWEDQVMVLKEQKLERLKERVFESMSKKYPDVGDPLGSGR